MASSDLLSLGCGWTGSFLLPQLEKRGYRYWFTTTGDPPSTRPASTPRALPSPPKNTGPTNLPTFTGPPSKFDPWPYLPAECWDRHSLLRLPDALTNPEWEDRVRALPPARVVLLVFPIRNADVLRQLVHTYESLYPDLHPSWVMLGSTGLWKGRSSGATTLLETCSTEWLSTRGLRSGPNSYPVCVSVKICTRVHQTGTTLASRLLIRPMREAKWRTSCFPCSLLRGIA